MIAGENAETAGIVRDGFVESKFGGEIRHRFLDDRAGTGFSIGILAGEIFLESVVNLFQLAQKSFVGGEFLQPGLARELEHANGIVVGPVPKLGIEMAKEAASRGFPCPPDVEADLAQRLECWGKGRDYIIALEGRHDRKRANIASLSRNGKAANLGRSGKGGAGAMSDNVEGQLQEHDHQDVSQTSPG